MANECIEGCLPALYCSNAQPGAWTLQVQIKLNEEQVNLTFVLTDMLQSSINDTIYWGKKMPLCAIIA